MSLPQDAASNLDAASKKGDDEEDQNKAKRRTPVVKTIFEFYNAPFTKFWFNTVSLDIVFLLCYCRNNELITHHLHTKQKSNGVCVCVLDLLPGLPHAV